MAEFTRSTFIDAPVARVWAALDDIASIEQWNPGVRESRLIGTQPSGDGAARYCDLGGRNYVHEEVVAHEPERALTMRITKTNLPFDEADIRFRLQPEGSGTRVTVSPAYRLRFGLLGAALDASVVRRTYSRGMAALLAGLKRHVEEPLQGDAAA
jgi:uncharacterized protein YndB with AHSA1/START domain